MTDILFKLALIVPNLIIFIAVGYYLMKLFSKEKELEKKEEKIDTNYHHVVDEALTKERKILEDAVTEADEIIAGAQYVSKGSKDVVREALQSMAVDIQKEALSTAQNFTKSYQLSLKDVSLQSLSEFQDIMKKLKEDLGKDIIEFREKLLPNMEKELEDYKKTRIAETDKLVTQIVRIASQEILNKTISLDDHKKLIQDSLDKAKKEGAFD